MPLTPTTSARRSDTAGLLIRRDAGAAVGLACVGDLDELQRDAVRVAEVHPAPAGEHALVDRGDVAEELDALFLELTYLAVDVIDMEADVVRTQCVLGHGLIDRRGRGGVLEELDLV